ncbi:MAG: hypothetical protein JSR70_09470 [Proteobacteria bacterium]|nr:hypothetical protein [Pseudomonadota bacterium]
MSQESLIVNEARRWLGTSYHPAGDVLGVGVDCAMLLVRVFVDTGLVPPLDPRPYPPDWHLHRDRERFLGWVQDYADKVDDPRPGDVALFRFGRAMSHGGIVETIKPEPVMIHADMHAGCVERCEVRRFGDRFCGYWRVRA